MVFRNSLFFPSYSQYKYKYTHQDWNGVLVDCENEASFGIFLSIKGNGKGITAAADLEDYLMLLGRF